MSLDINGYNNVFRNFAEFAQNSLNAGDAKAANDAEIPVVTDFKLSQTIGS